MNPTQPEQQDYNEPVAYDKNGNPLYAHPPVEQVSAAPRPQVVQMTRAAEPAMPYMSDQARARHEEAKQLYPTLNLSEGEYIINEVRRHPIGMVGIIAVAVILIGLVIGFLVAYPFLTKDSTVIVPSLASLALPALLFILLILLATYIAIFVYRANKFFLTNESVIQEIQTSLFAKREQTVSLANIEDASYRQTGIIQTMFDYGSIRLSTEGDETTYRFYYVSQPKRQIATLNNAVEAFKNGRPVTGD